MGVSERIQELSDRLSGDDGSGGGAVGPDDVIDPDSAEKGLGRFPGQPPIVVPPPAQDYVVWWANEDACEECLENNADNPRPFGEPFSSGNIMPPAHDHCRCNLMSAMRGAGGCPMHGHRIFELSSRY